MKIGDLVRHKHAKVVGWGVGVVVERLEDKVRINFEHHGTAVFKVAAAGAIFAPVAPDEIEPESPLLNPARWASYATAPESRPTKRTVIAPCSHCGEPLRRARTLSGRALKSCPGCSQQHGAEHVFYESPLAFGTSEKRITRENPDGVQSHCRSCRRDGSGEYAARPCSSVSGSNA